MIADATPTPLLEVTDLKTHFPVKAGVFRSTVAQVKAVDGVTFHVNRGETLGLVGESGCGKTTVGRTLLRLIEKTAGSVVFHETTKNEDGSDKTVARNIYDLGGAELKRMRRKMQIIFQDPVGSLNPRMTVGRIVGEPMQVHGIAKGSELNDRVEQLLERVGLSADYASRYPHEFSGGQRQRVGIARALGLGPDFIVCDEPVSALDVSIQSQILNLLNDLQDEMGIAYLFIAHNLAVVEQFSDRVAVMYLGRIVEVADRDDLYRQALHPYTKALMSAVPEPKPVRDKGRIVLPGEVPSPMHPPTGCHFHPRCPLTRQLADDGSHGETVRITVEGQTETIMAACVNDVPPLESGPTDDNEHCVACHFAEQGLAMDDQPAPPPLPSGSA